MRTVVVVGLDDGIINAFVRAIKAAGGDPQPTRFIICESPIVADSIGFYNRKKSMKPKILLPYDSGLGDLKALKASLAEEFPDAEILPLADFSEMILSLD